MVVSRAKSVAGAGSTAATSVAPSTTVKTGGSTLVAAGVAVSVAGISVEVTTVRAGAGGGAGGGGTAATVASGAGAVCRTGGSGVPPGSTMRGSSGWSKLSSSANNDIWSVLTGGAALLRPRATRGVVSFGIASR